MAHEEFPPVLPCPLGGPDMMLLYRLPRIWAYPTNHEARPFGMYWSEQLGFGRLHPLPADEELQLLYDSPEYDNYMSGASSSAERRARGLRRLRDHLAWRLDKGHDLTVAGLHQRLGKISRVCDLGCGSAVLLEGLQKLGHDVLGLDPHPAARASGAERGIEILAGTIEALPHEFPTNHFDMVLMLHMLEHCRDPVAALATAKELLVPGGVLVCEVPNHAALAFKLYGACWFHTDAGRHMYFFTARSLEAALQRAGLTPVGREFAGYCRQFSYLESERRVWERLYQAPATSRDKPPPRPSELSKWRLFAQTILAPHERKYEAVRVFATRP